MARKGSVRRRKDTGKYVIDFYDNLGKRHVETIGTNWHEANRALDQRMAEINDGVFAARSRGETFKGRCESWLKGKVKIKPATLRTYEAILSVHLIPYFGEAKLSEISRKNIQDFVKALVDRGECSPKSIHNILSVLREILVDAQADGSLIRNPYLKIEKPAIVKIEVDPLGRHEIELFLKSCEPENRALFYTAIFTGMRRGELLGLKWGDIDMVNGQILVRRSLYRGRFQEPKSRSSKRKIDMGPRLAEVLKRHKAKQSRAEQSRIRLKAGEEWVDNELVFCTPKGAPLDADNLYHRDFKRILKRAGLRQIRIHDLRHTFAAILIAAGHHPKYIQSRMGHYSITGGERRVAVGMLVARHPPHRSVLEELPHTAPASGGDAETHPRVGMTDTGWGKPPFHEAPHAGPGYAALLAAAVESLPPQTRDFPTEGGKGVAVHGHAVVSHVTRHHRAQIGAHLGHWLMHTPAKLCANLLKLRLPPRAHRLANHRELA
jgi:integrase